jgi:UDP-glucose 4-epimerase
MFRDVYGLDTVCLRYFNVYGPWQDPNSQYAAVIPKFITGALEGKAPVIFGNGEQTRDFVYVRDAVAAAIILAESEASGVHNVGTGNAVTINELAQLILKIAGNDIAIIHQEARLGDIKDSLSDISRIRALGWAPAWNLEEGLRETVGYYAGRLEPALAH